MVMIYEGIVANVLDYDYAPQSECIENRRVYLNVSQVRGSSQAPHSVCLSLRYAHFVSVSRFFRTMRDLRDEHAHIHIVTISQPLAYVCICVVIRRASRTWSSCERRSCSTDCR
jgi:hypothetical protein